MQSVAKQEDIKNRVCVTVLLPAKEKKSYLIVFKVTVLPIWHLRKFNQRNKI